jgi:hypothetical protein
MHVGRQVLKAGTSLADRHDNGKAWLYEVELYAFHVGTLECPPLPHGSIRRGKQ